MEAQAKARWRSKLAEEQWQVDIDKERLREPRGLTWWVILEGPSQRSLRTVTGDMTTREL